MDNCTNISLRRRAIWQAGLAVFLISACDRKPMRVHLDISLFSYLNRPIYEVSMNGTHFGGAMRNSFYGSNAVMLMQPIVLGPQLVSWRLDGPEGMPRNGELVMAKNTPLFTDVPGDATWLALHIYPDETVEIKLSTGTPGELETERGKSIVAEWEAKTNES